MMLPLCVLFALTASAAPAKKEALPLRRFALLIGANDGGAQRPPLKYAIDDAEAFGRVLSELGGVTSSDSRLIENPSVEGLRNALEQLRQELGALPALTNRVEVLLYYSGHSDEEGLLLKGARLPYAEIREWLGVVPASVRIAILDSCASGTLTRGKGGVRTPPFLIDSSTQVHGHAILTSSSETEASQESDTIGGSFFTHALLSAMRGAADGTHDGRVTLNEAYQFTFDETLARTEKTRGGAQHPAYDIQLVGTGDLVMTDLHAGSATLVLPEATLGRFFVRDQHGRLVAELRKFAGRLVELGLEPGTYSMTRELDGVVSEGRVTLAAAERAPLDVTTFRTVSREATARRGTASEPSEYRWQPVDIAVFPTFSVTGDARMLNNLSISLLAGRSTRLEGLAFSVGGHWVDEAVVGAQLSVGFNLARQELRGAQLAVGANIAGGTMNGVQLGVGLNLLMPAEGAEQSKGAQLGVGVNAIGNPFKGAQLGVGLNLGGPSFTGAQVAVGANVGGSVTGLQFAVAANVAAHMHGLQASLINVGVEMSGLQLGLINVAGTVKGVQVGLLNFAGSVEGESIGLLSVSANGLHRPEVWFEDASVINAGIKLGGRHLYVLPTVALVDSKKYASGIGLGIHLTPDSPFSVDLDGVMRWVNHFSGASAGAWVSARAVVDYRFFSHLHAFAGPSLNWYFSLDGHAIARMPNWSIGGDRSMWVGLIAGVGF